MNANKDLRLALSVWLCIAGCRGYSGYPTRKVELLSPVYTVDKIYRSMQGPSTTQEVHLLETKPAELLWIRGYRAVMVGPDGKSPQSQEFMCHSNLDVDWNAFRAALPEHHQTSARLFTLSQGQFEIHFPDGFGIPVMSDTPLELTTQVLNHNLPNPNVQVRHKVTVEYVRDRDLKRPMTPLFQAGVYGLKLVEGQTPYFGVEHPDAARHGSGCLLGAAASKDMYDDGLGRTFTGHWVVKPGREENRTLVTKELNLPFDTTIHYIAVHLHPLAESLELRDMTEQKTLFKSRAQNLEGRIGLEHVEAFSSAEGISVYENHGYELVSVYNNTTDRDQDSMAVMYLYLYDREFHRPGGGEI